MRDKEPRQSNIVVQVVDTSSLIQECVEWMKKNGHTEADKITGAWFKFNKLGFVETSKGVFIICDEGVGSWVNDKDKKFDISVYAEFESDEGKGFSIIPTLSVHLKASDIKRMKVTGQENLVTFIRTFGSRLDANFRIMNDELTEAIA